MKHVKTVFFLVLVAVAINTIACGGEIKKCDVNMGIVILTDDCYWEGSATIEGDEVWHLLFQTHGPLTKEATYGFSSSIATEEGEYYDHYDVILEFTEAGIHEFGFPKPFADMKWVNLYLEVQP